MGLEDVEPYFTGEPEKEEETEITTKTGREVLLEKAQSIEEQAESIQEELGAEGVALAKKPPTEAKGERKKPTPGEVMTWDEWLNLWNERVEEYGPTAKKAWNELRPKLEKAGVKTEEEFKEFLEEAEPAVKSAWETLKPKLEDFSETLSKKWESLKPKVQEKLYNAFNKLKEII